MKRERRVFIGGAAAGLLAAACGGAQDSARDEASGSSAGSGGKAGAGGSAGQGSSSSSASSSSGGPLSCTETADNLLGPYYRPGAPFRSDLTELEMPGTRVTIQGSVTGPDCSPIAGALLDFWQADDDGGYDNDGANDPPPGTFVLRGKQESDVDGRFALRTIIPGHYLNGAQYRPAHIHVTVSAPGYRSLTTQLYFEGDPYNDIDPFIIDSLIMSLEEGSDGEKLARFDFVLEPAS